MIQCRNRCKLQYLYLFCLNYQNRCNQNGCNHCINKHEGRRRRNLELRLNHVYLEINKHGTQQTALTTEQQNAALVTTRGSNGIKAYLKSSKSSLLCYNSPKSGQNARSCTLVARQNKNDEKKAIDVEKREEERPATIRSTPIHCRLSLRPTQCAL